MAEKLSRKLQKDGEKNCLGDVIPRLLHFLQKSIDVESAALCCKDAVFVQKLPREGNDLCGYRNIQMLSLAIIYAGTAEKIPQSILEIQTGIEKAWQNGINAHAEAQIGSIYGTQKHIGTSEAEAFFLNLGIKCSGHIFDSKNAVQELFAFLEAYFKVPSPGEEAIVCTDCLPVFLQRPGHSVSVMGIARMKNGQQRLLVMDPAIPTPPGLRQDAYKSKLVEQLSRRMTLNAVLKSSDYFKKYDGFEVLVIDKQSSRPV